MKPKIKLHWLLAGAAGAVWLSGAGVLSANPATDAKIQELEQKLKILERKLELSEEATANKLKALPAPAKDAATVTAGARGVRVQSADKAFQFQVNGLVQVDSRFYLEGSNSSDTFDARRVRPTLRGTLWNDLEFRFTPELSGTVRILDAFGNYKVSDALNIQFGNFKSPVGLERLQGGANLRFNERGYATEFTPARDLGIQLHGAAVDSKLAWKFGVFNGAIDGYNGAASANAGNDFDIAGSVFVNPFKGSDNSALSGLGIGFAASWGKQSGDAAFRVRSTSRADVARANDLTENGHSYRLNPQLTYYNGPFGLLAEYIISSRHLGKTGIAHKRYSNNAWTAQASYILTGEDNSYGGVRPSSPFRWGAEGSGAWEIAVRYTGVRFDKDLWSNRLLNASQAEHANTFSAGVNWYATENLKAAISYDYTNFKGGKAGGGDRKSDHTLLTRFQVAF